MEVPTVRIKHGDGVCLINEEDYDEKIHQLAEEVPAKVEEARKVNKASDAPAKRETLKKT